MTQIHDLSTQDTEQQVPTYLLGADNHNIGNSLGGSWFSPETWDAKFSNAGRFIAASVLSGADSVYNSGVTVGNWFGADAQLSDTQAWISALDSDLGQYYSENRQSADLAGFIASSLIPGIGGIKILNAGQAALKAAKFEGAIGRNLAQYTNILAPSTENYVKLARSEIVAAQSVFSGLSANTLKALGSGLWQNTLEAAAFEAMVQATMFKSPILEAQDNWDIAKNIAIGGVLGGVIGGSFQAAKTLSAVKKARIEEDIALKPFSSREVVQPGTSPADRIILAAENRSFTPSPLKPLLPENPSATEIQLAEVQLANARVAREKKFRDIDLANRRALHEMNKGANDDLINALADTNNGIGVEQAIQRWHNAAEITSPTTITKAERQAIENLEPGFQSRYIEIAGETPGRVSYEMPAILSVADRLSGKSGRLEDHVRAAVKDAGFTTAKLWDPLAKNTKLSWREAELRHIWANEAKSLPENLTIHANDIPLLERMLKDNRLDFKIVPNEKVTEAITFSSRAEFERFLIEHKEELANSLLAKRLGKVKADTDPIETTTAAIAKVVNVKQAYLEGTRNTINPRADLFAWQSLSEQIHAQKIASGVRNQSDDVVPEYFQPKVAKINYKVENQISADGHILDALVFIKSRQKVLHEDAIRVVTKQAGSKIADRMVDVRIDDLQRTNTYGAGPSMLGSAQSAYGSIESRMQYLGGVSKDLQIAKRAEVDGTMQDALYKLASNQRAAIEFDTINQQLSRTSEQYVFDTDNFLGQGVDTLIPKKVRDAYKKAGEDGDIPDISLQPGSPEYIRIANWETKEALKSHNALTTSRTLNAQERWAAQGKLDQKAPDVIRPIRPQPKDFPYFAFVKDPKVTGSGHTTMLFGNSEKELQDLIVKTQRDFPDLRVITKKDTADWYEAHGNYEYERGLNENYIDSEMRAKGIYSNFYTRSDPQAIVNDILQYHYRSADLEAAEIMRLRYGEAFDWLENQAQSYSQFETSKFAGGKLETITQNEKNPYLSYIKTALNLSSTPTSNPWWSLNKFLDNQVSRAVGRMRQAFDAAKSPEDLRAVNAMMEEYGSQTAFNSAAEAALINHTAPKAELSKFVRGANAIMSRFTLGLDPLNALNNAIGANVLRGTELSLFTRAINAGNTELAGELAKLAKVRVPGAPSEIISAQKLIANSIKRFFGEDGKQLIEEYKSIGIIRDRLEQFKSMADDLTLKGTETVTDLQKRMQGAFTKAKALADKGETLTGNKFAEEFNRFISADVMRQMTDLGVKHGVLDSREALTYINTFVNRVEGNILAAQRPGLFQGPLGQAIGLFQSYQFNLLQQLFRYVAEGEKKDLAMLLGLQGTLYGLQGEPGFKFVNDHIVGTASGNKNHRDLYDATRGVFGKEAGDWLLYGAASNLLQTNIYSRGDINPRNVTIVPVNIADVPFVGGMSRVFGSLYETTKKIANGGDVWESIRQGIEHNGVSRPLAGLAQVSRAIDNDGNVFATSGKGTILGSNDLMSLASLSRMAGGRPLDEAIQNDTMFSINSYEAYDRAKRHQLAETIKTTMVKNKTPDANEVTAFAEQYSYLGGKQSNFAKYMMEQYTKANTPAAELLAQKLNNPLSYKIQALMGGEQ
jgi:hypothetical protein